MFERADKVPDGAIQAFSVAKIRQGEWETVTDEVAVEEPLEIRLDFWNESGIREQKSISITMRTPGHDFELAAGFLYTEGIVKEAGHILEIKHCGPALPRLGHSNVIKITLGRQVAVNLKALQRHFYTSSSCGVCGKASIEALHVQSPYADLKKGFVNPVAAELIQLLPERMRAAQDVFEDTGGLHASALFDREGRLLSIREDVGRHNALDKIIGHALLAGRLPLAEDILLLSGRVSFELVQKAAMAGIQVLSAVGAPSSLALELANDRGMTVMGFVRPGRFNLYCGGWRIDTSAAETLNPKQKRVDHGLQ